MDEKETTTHTTYLVSVAALKSVRGTSIARAFAHPNFPTVDAEEGYGLNEEERDYTQQRPFLIWYLWTRPRGVQFCVGRNEDDSRMVVLIPDEADHWNTSNGPTPLTDAFNEYWPANADRAQSPGDFSLVLVSSRVIESVGWDKLRRCVLRYCSGDPGQYGDRHDAQIGVGRYRVSAGTLSVAPEYRRHVLFVSLANGPTHIARPSGAALYRRNS